MQDLGTEPLAASGESPERGGGHGEETGEDRHADAGRRVPVVPIVAEMKGTNTKPLAYYYKFRGSTDCQ